MPKYRLLISFDVKPPDSSPFAQSFDEIKEFKHPEDAEKELEAVLSAMVSRFSDQGFEWTLLEKCIELQKDRKESDLPTLLL